MTTEIRIDHVRRDHVRSTHGSGESSVSEGVVLSAPGSEGSSGSDRSESHESRDYVHVPLAPEVPYAGEEDLEPEDSFSEAPRPIHRHHHRTELGHHRGSAHPPERRYRGYHDHAPLEYRPRGQHPPPPESVESYDEYAGQYARPGLPVQRQTYTYGAPQYAPSQSEPYQYPPVPSTQMVHAGQQQPLGYGQFPQASHHGSHNNYYPQSVMPSPGALPYQSHFSPPAAVPYGAPPSGYFPPYAGVPQYAALPPQAYYPYPPARSESPAAKKSASPPPANDASHEETIKMMKAMFEHQQKQIEERDKAKEAERKAIEDAKKQAEERAAADKKLQEEATAAAKKAGDQALQEAADKMKKDMDAAKAAAEKEMQEAKEKAEKELADAKAAAEKALKDAQEAAEKKTAEEVAAAKAPAPGKKLPVKFKDAIGRKYQFPWEMCSKWNNMEELIRQAFAHVEGMAQHVYDGHYDLSGPTGEIILKDCWEATVEPDWTITMHMWPLPEEPKVPFDDDILVLPLDPKVKKDGKGGKKGAKIPVVSEKKKKAPSKGHGSIPVPPAAPSAPSHLVFDDAELFGEIPILDVPGPSDSKAKKAGKARPQSGLFGWGSSRPKPKKK